MSICYLFRLAFLLPKIIQLLRFCSTQISESEGQEQEDIFSKKECLLVWSLTLRAAQQHTDLDLPG